MPSQVLLAGDQPHAPEGMAERAPPMEIVVLLSTVGSSVSHVHMDVAAEGTHIPCVLFVSLLASLRDLLKRKGGKKSS